LLRTDSHSFHGHPESWWFTNITYRASNEEIYQWRSYGPEGVQVLIHALERGNRQRDQAYVWLWRRAPASLRDRLPTPANNRAIRMCAGSMLGLLGADAKPAVPALLENLKIEKDDSVRQIVLGCFEGLLKALGDQEKQKLLPIFLDSAKSRDAGVRNNALVALQFYPQDPRVLPVMTGALKDGDVGVRLTAAKMLDQMDHQAALKAGVVVVVVECLTNAQTSSHSWIAAESAFFLGHLKSDPGLVVPALIGTLHDPDTYARGNSAYSLGQFGPQARAAIPELLKALDDSEPYVRDQAARAIKSIDPAAAKSSPQ